MKLDFKLYANGKAEYNSTIFDFIHGDKETKQTKSLAYILSQYEDFLFIFLEYAPIKAELERVLKSPLNRKAISSIEVSAERMTEGMKRADVVIKIDVKRKPLVAIIVEAKSIKVSVNKSSLVSQINHYLHEAEFSGLADYPRVAVVLTKYKESIPGIASVTWDEIVQLLIRYTRKKSGKELVVQYLNFLLEIDKAMKYYEKEVLSIPAGKSLDRVHKYKIYECPDTPEYNYKKPLFMCFRQSKGGEMNCLYKIEDIVIFNPVEKSELETFKNSTLQDHVKTRVLAYIKDTTFPAGLDHDKRFYILSETENIPLAHLPRPERNNAKFTYYSLVDVLTKQVVVPESKTR